ncbi:helix-turn-helix domain-containing protein [Streptomyces cellulosae]
MAAALDDLLGIDPDDPAITAATEDAEAYASLVESLVVLRKKRGLTQRDVAASMETTQSTVSDFERVGGDAKYSTLQRYARAVGARLCTMVASGDASLTPTWQKATDVPVRLAPKEAEHPRMHRGWHKAAEGAVTLL